MHKSQQDGKRSWETGLLDESSKKDALLIEKLEEEERTLENSGELTGAKSLESMEKILENTIEAFENMLLTTEETMVHEYSEAMERMSRDQLLISGREVSVSHLYHEDSFCLSDVETTSDMDGLDVYVGPLHLDVSSTSELFRNGRLELFIRETESEANNLQGDLLYALDSSDSDLEDEEEREDKNNKAESSTTNKFVVKGTIPFKVPQRKPSVSKSRVLNAQGYKGWTFISPKGVLIPGPSSSNPRTFNVDGNVSTSVPQPQSNRKIAVAARKYSARRSGELPQISKGTVVRQTNIFPKGSELSAATSVKSILKPLNTTVNKQSLPPKVNSKPEEKRKFSLPSVINLPPGITVVPLKSNAQGVFLPTRSKSFVGPSSISISTIPKNRRTRKSPQKSPLYSENRISRNITEILRSRKRFEMIQHKISSGKGKSSRKILQKNERSVYDMISDADHRLIVALAKVLDFIWKLHLKVEDGTLFSSEEEVFPEETPEEDGSWFLECPTCYKTFPLINDIIFKQHLIAKHSIEVDDMGIHATKFFSQTLFACRTCSESFYGNREGHRLECSPRIPLNRAFERVFVANQKKVIQCSICITMFDSRVTLREHVREIHGNIFRSIIIDPEYRCSRCLKFFGNAAALTGHVLICHKRLALASKSTILEIAHAYLKCGICVTPHMKINEAINCYAKKKTIRCILCMYTCLSRKCFMKHMTVFHRKNRIGIKCPFCPDSEFAPIRAQFNHIIDDHYIVALTEEAKQQELELKKKNRLVQGTRTGSSRTDGIIRVRSVACQTGDFTGIEETEDCLIPMRITRRRRFVSGRGEKFLPPKPITAKLPPPIVPTKCRGLCIETLSGTLPPGSPADFVRNPMLCCQFPDCPLKNCPVEWSPSD